MASRRRRSRWASEAALQALVRFGPERSGLRTLEREERSTYRQTVRSARGAAQSQIQEIGQARPQVRKAYDRAGLMAARAAHDVIAPVTAGLGPSAASLKGAVGIEQAGLQQRLKESEAAALTGLAQRRVQARQGEAYAVSSAGRDLKAGLTKIFERQQDLAREKGAFQALTVQQLRQAASDRADRFKIEEMGNTQQERNSLRSAGIDPNTGKPIKGGKLDPKAKKDGKGGKGGSGGATTEKHLEWQTSIDEITNAARRYKGKLTRAQIVEKLQRGRPQQTIDTDPRTGQKLKVKAVLPAIPQYKADLRMTAALDIALDGHLSKATQQKLHRSGFSLSQLGLPTYGAWRKHAANYEKRTGRPARG